MSSFIYESQLIGNNKIGYVNPVGTVLPFAGSTIPVGYLLCNGDAVSRTTYADLYAVIGDTYGSGDGSTTFNLPDIRGQVPVGAGSHTDVNGTTFTHSIGDEGGEYTHTLTVSELPVHRHGQGGHTYSWGSDSGNINIANAVAQTGATSGNRLFTYQNTNDWANTMTTGGDGAHNNVQPYLIVNYIIKAVKGCDEQATVTLADMATKDGSGNNIVNTYVKKDSLLYGAVKYTNYAVSTSGTTITCVPTFTINVQELRPIFFTTSGDFQSSDANDAWFTLGIYIDGTRVKFHTFETGASAFSHNKAFTLEYMFIPTTTGNHTVMIQAAHGTGIYTMAEGGTLQIPYLYYWQL